MDNSNPLNDWSFEASAVTLEFTIEAQNISMPEWDFNNPSTIEAGAYAAQVSGEIRAV